MPCVAFSVVNKNEKKAIKKYLTDSRKGLST